MDGSTVGGPVDEVDGCVSPVVVSLEKVLTETAGSKDLADVEREGIGE